MYRSAMLISILILTACSAPSLSFAQPSPTPIKPQVIITAPISGTSFAAGAEVAVQSISSDASGIVRVELLVDGQVVRHDAIPTGKSQPQFQVAQTWKTTTPGAHTIIVRATNEKGATGEAALSLTISEPPKPTNTLVPTATPPPPTSTSVPTPTKTLTPTPAPTVTQYTLALNEEQFNAIANAAMPWSDPTYWESVAQYAHTPSTALRNGQIAISATYAPPNLKPTIARIVLTANVSNCEIHVRVVTAGFGLSTLPEGEKTPLGDSIEQLLKNLMAQQGNYTCVDSITIANGVMTIKYH